MLAAACAVAALGPSLWGGPDELVGGLAAAATADGLNPEATTVQGFDVTSTGPAEVTGAWSDPQEPAALFVYAGSASAPGRCADYAAVRVAEQDEETVVLDADRYAPAAPPPPDHACTAIGHPPQQHRLDLGIPLDGRRVVDTDGQELEVIDTGKLLVPTALPDGYRRPGAFQAGAGFGGNGDGVALHTYAGPGSGTQIEIHQGLSEKVPGSDEPVHPSVVLDRPAVRGHPAVVTVTTGFDDLTCLRWRESDDLAVSVCSRGAPAPLDGDQLQSVAASLRQARDATN